MSTTSISWNDVAGIVWGGELNVKTGLLSATHKHKFFDGTETWEEAGTGSNKYFTHTLENYGEGRAHRIISSHYIYSGNITSSSTNIGVDTLNSSTSNVFRLCVRPNNVANMSINNFKAWLAEQAQNNTPFEIVYQITTPLEYNLTPTEIRSLLGQNNIWADCGAITELKYTRDLNLCINDIIARIEALEGANSSRSLSLSANLTKSIVSDSDTAEEETKETEEETKEEAQNER